MLKINTCNAVSFINTPHPIHIPIPNNPYQVFESFMLNPTYIRYGVSENIVTWRLVAKFNEATNQNISFNATLPKFMKQFMETHPQYNIRKKTRKDGVTYIGIGLNIDEIPEPKLPPVTTQANNEKKQKERNDKRAITNRTVAARVKQEILQKTNWTEQQLIQIVNLKLLPAIKNGGGFNIDIMIMVAMGNITLFICDRINELEDLIRKAKIIEYNLNKATEQDEFQSKEQIYPVFTNRLRFVENENGDNVNTVYDMGNYLQRKIDRYVRIIQDLPHFNNIVYPDIQQVFALVDRLKNFSPFKIRQNMAKVQEEFTDNETPQAVNWTFEDNLLEYVEDETVMEEDFE